MRFRLSLDFIDMFFNLIQILSLLRKTLPQALQFLGLALLHVLPLVLVSLDKWSTMSSAAFSRLLNESLEATPPDRVPPTAPTYNQHHPHPNNN